MPQIRLSPSGPPLNGVNPGDIIVWDGTQWIVTTNTAASELFAVEIATQDVESPGPPIALNESLVVPVLVGQRIFVQAVLTLTWIGLNDFQAVFQADAATFWGQGVETQDGSEGGLAWRYPMQAMTAPAVAAGNVAIEIAAAAANVGAEVFGHLCAQVF